MESPSSSTLQELWDLRRLSLLEDSVYLSVKKEK